MKNVCKGQDAGLGTYLLVHMTSVLFYELCEAHVIRAQLTETVEDTSFAGVKEGQVLGHL